MAKIRDYHAEYLKRETRGRHPQEEAKFGKTLPKRSGKGKIKYAKKRKGVQVYQKQPKSILDQIKEKWNLFSYVDIFQFYFSLNTRDITKAVTVDQIKLYALHEFFREFFDQYFGISLQGLEYEATDIEKIYIESDTRREIPGRFRYFEFLYINDEEDTTIFFLQYWKGRIRKGNMPKRFWSYPFSKFLKLIKKIGLWE